ncbi:microtubule-associated protein 70-3 [Hordeum vulgare]|nr:microtubule-associated protein 70-3 [Hordeum vulgare]
MPGRPAGLRSEMADGGEEGNAAVPRGFSRRRGAVRASLDADELMALMHGSDPVRVELTRLENELRDKERELGEAHTEIRALRLSERAREKPLRRLNCRLLLRFYELERMDEKLKLTESHLENKEENKILDKLHRQKVAEVEKLSQTDERKTLDRELARAKVTANRVAVVVANEWKDSNDKVMPVKQWLEERRFMQGEMQQLRDKLAVAERTARSEAQLKEKFQLRLKVLEDGLRGPPSGSSRPPTEGKSFSNGPSRRLSLGGADNVSKVSPNGLLTRRSPSFHSRSSLSSSSSLILKHAKGTSKSFDGGTRSLDRGKVHGNGSHLLNKSTDAVKDREADDGWKGTVDEGTNGSPKGGGSLRKACHEKDQSLKDKDDAIEMLARKVDTLTKAMEVEAKKMRREVAAMEKEVAAMRVDKDQEIKARRLGNSKGSGSSQLLPGRYIFTDS